MEMLPIIFAKGRHPISYMIRAVTWSRWSHVGVLHDGDLEWNGKTYTGLKVIEAAGGIGTAVTPYSEFKARYNQTATAEIPCDGLGKAYERLIEQLGKPYDFWALLGIALRVGSWADDTKWFCSELLAYATGLWRVETNKRVTPDNIWRASR